MLENCIWAITNLCSGNPDTTRHVITQLKIPRIIGYSLKVCNEPSTIILRLIELLVRVFKEVFEKGMLPDFVDLINSLGSLLEPYYFRNPTEGDKEERDYEFLWFFAVLTDNFDDACQVIFDYVPIVPILMRMLSSKEITQTTVALRLVGNFASANENDYIENFFKNDLLNNLVIGWRHFDGLVDLEREIGWILANLVTTF